MNSEKDGMLSNIRSHDWINNACQPPTSANNNRLDLTKALQKLADGSQGAFN